MNIEELQAVAANAKTSLEQYLALQLINILKKHPPVGYVHSRDAFCSPDHGDQGVICRQQGVHYNRPLYGDPQVTIVNLNHIGRITAQVSGQRYTYLSAEDVRHVFEELKCPIVEYRKEPSPYVWFPEIK